VKGVEKLYIPKKPLKVCISLFVITVFLSFAGVQILHGEEKETNPPATVKKIYTAVPGDKHEAVDAATSAGPKVEKPSLGEKTGAAKKEGNEVQQEQDIMEAALRLLSESHEYWVQGDVENAIEMLDQAYALILDTDGDPAIARQKDDLRLLISKRILAIYSAKQTSAPGKRGEIPIVLNPDVEKEIRSFQTVERDFFISSYQRSGLYRPYIVSELKRLGLPEELSWLPLVESGYKIKALSPARALGLWQFIPSTGYKYGLERDQWVDERMDPEKSTRAAIAYLRDLHGMFGDWLTVLAAYNCGEGRVLREISRQHINYLDRFWDLYHQLPYETARYVPRFLATIHIVRNPKKYGMDLGDLQTDPLLARGYETVKTNKSMRLQDIAERLNVPEETLSQLNPELRYKITPEKEYLLKIPAAAAEQYAKVADSIPHWEQPPPTPKARPVVITHRVKRGETIASIAKKYRTSPKAIRSYNHLSAKTSLVVGQHLSIPIRNSRTVKKTAYQTAEFRVKKVAAGGDILQYKVKKGDTLARVAARNQTTVQAIKEANHLRSNSLKVGQVLRISPAGQGSGEENGGGDNGRKKTKKIKASVKAGRNEAEKKSGEKTYVVKKGDSLFGIARTHDMDVDRLCALNHISDRKGVLRAGQVLVVE